MSDHTVDAWLKGLSPYNRGIADQLAERVGQPIGHLQHFTVDQAIIKWRIPGDYSTDAVTDRDIRFLRAFLEGKSFPDLPEASADDPRIFRFVNGRPVEVDDTYTGTEPLYQIVGGQYKLIDVPQAPADDPRTFILDNGIPVEVGADYKGTGPFYQSVNGVLQLIETPELAGLGAGAIVAPPEGAVAAAFERGNELIYDRQRGIYFEQAIPDEPPPTLQAEMERLFILGTEESIAKGRRLFREINALTPGAKVELAVRFATDPGDYVTYWALLHGDQPNVEFQPGVRRIPFSQLLANAGIDAGIFESISEPPRVHGTPPTAMLPGPGHAGIIEGDGVPPVVDGVPPVVDDVPPVVDDVITPQQQEILAAKIALSEDQERIRGLPQVGGPGYLGPPFYSPEEQAQLDVIAAQQAAAAEAAQQAAAAEAVAAEAANILRLPAQALTEEHAFFDDTTGLAPRGRARFKEPDVATISTGGEDVDVNTYAKGGIVGQHGPELALLGTHGPEYVIPLTQGNPLSKVSLRQLMSGRNAGLQRFEQPPVARTSDGREIGIFNEPTIVGTQGDTEMVITKPGRRLGQVSLGQLAPQVGPGGAFDLLTGQARQEAISQAPAYGTIGRTTQPPRLLPSLGAPRFPSAQQLRRAKPTEFKAFKSFAAQTGIEIGDYLAQLEKFLPSFPQRSRLPVFRARAISGVN